MLTIRFLLLSRSFQSPRLFLTGNLRLQTQSWLSSSHLPWNNQPQQLLNFLLLECYNSQTTPTTWLQFQAFTKALSDVESQPVLRILRAQPFQAGVAYSFPTSSWQASGSSISFAHQDSSPLRDSSAAPLFCKFSPHPFSEFQMVPCNVP